MKPNKGKSNSRIKLLILTAYVFVALFAPLLANEKPLYLFLNGHTYFPAFNSNPYILFYDKSGHGTKLRSNSVDWKNLEADNMIFPPIAWPPVHSDLMNQYASPFSKQYYIKRGIKTELPTRLRHFMGTGKTGNDVLAGLIHGSRTSLTIGFISTLIALLIGIVLGCIAGYFGDDRIRISRIRLIAILLLAFPAFFYSFYLRADRIIDAFHESAFMGLVHFKISLLIFIAIILLPLFPFRKKKNKIPSIRLPIDNIISRTIEIFLSLPRLVMILTLAAIIKPSLLTIILIIGLTSWTDVARIVRAQVLQLRQSNFVEASKAFGSNPFSIILRQVFPLLMPQLFVLCTFSIASAILVETGLSFLGIGLPVGTATWGGLMYEARENYSAWWMVIFSGGAISILLYTLYSFGKQSRLGKIVF